MKNLTIPSIFTAVDKFTGPVNKMANNAGAAFARMDRKMNRIGKTSKKIARNSAIVSASIIAPIGLLANEAIKFEQSMSDVSTIIDTNTESLDKMGEKILDMSTELPVATSDLTASLYDIRSAGIAANDQFNVLEQSAKLSKAGLSDVSEATDITTSALNAFKSENLSASEVTNILFKSVKFGKTTISELSQAFGGIAPLMESSGVKLRDFSAATAALTTTGTPAAQAQNQLKSAIAKLKGPTTEMEKVFKSLGVTTDKELIAKYGTLGDAFSAVNMEIEKQGLSAKKTWGSVEALAGVTSLTGATNEAYTKTLHDMASGTDALNEAFEKQANTGASQAQIAKNNMKALSITLGTALIPIINDLVKAVVPVLKSFGKWAKNNKGTVKTVAKLALGIAAFSGALSVIAGIISGVSKVFGVLNFIMNLNPVFLLITGVAALAAGLGYLATQINFTSRAQRLQNEVHDRALEKTIDQRVEVMLLFKTLRKAKVGTDEYSKTLAKIEKMQPGITKQYNLQAGALKDINAAEKDLINNIIKRAEQEVRAEMIKEKMREALEQEASGPGFADYLLSAGTHGMISADQFNQMDINDAMADAEELANQQVAAEQELLNPKKEEMTTTVENIKETRKDVNINFENVPLGVEIDGQTGSNITIPVMGNTRGK